jgi:glycosyltransferase involved in cell wall biosynthesis
MDLLLGCSDYVRDNLAGHFPQFADNCDSAYNGVDVESFQPTRRVRLEGDPVRVLYVGRLSPEKGVHILIDAFREIALRHRQAQLIIAGPKRQLPFDYLAPFTNDPVLRELEPWFEGDGHAAYYKHLKRLVSRYGLKNRVEFTGALPYSRVVEQYQQADVLVNPSFRESFGRSLIEAMACALPIVATDIGGMPEILDNERCGLLFPAGRTESLTAALDRLIESPELGRMMGAYGRRRAEEVYSWDAITDQAVSHYADMISGRLGRECARLSS